ncbi:transglutaminase domain-containing protein [Pedobacter sp. SYSU D00535]|uniref:transglutaminase domain-containing protein n=1 Tax=Pedobacter sp. SYSU D00535 TaxID=2810308 RepID=UPI001A972802|nr:transglutaminase domain-containing protein [Pedobacter sp. SYSU D00535]
MRFALVLSALLLISSTRAAAQLSSLNPSLYERFDALDLSNIKSVEGLVTKLKPLASNKKESLQLLYFWTYKYMSVDSARFFNASAPLSVSQSLVMKKGLCEELSNIFAAYCSLTQIPSLKIEGYVRPVNFTQGQTYEEGNHIWNAVFLDSQWYTCDLLWSISQLQVGKELKFVKVAKPAYFLADPQTFLPTHLPLAPVFQFSNAPIKMEAFTTMTTGFDTTLPAFSSMNYTDSLKVLLATNEKDREIKLAKDAYRYNPNNPNTLIIAAYNQAIAIISRQTASPAELRKARQYLNLAITHLPRSKKTDFIPLEECKRALSHVERRIAAK